ncbi:OmpA family protein [Variovorax sp. J22P168]|uniref:OmpA family protein n=1 Tax=Variovorax jilinensis TaxID=3053513 RepID=UPI002577E6EC|nr:OmpA family protein [Variovorax sp. J22P168]MDM0015054.1 OmpA family protein [Variovorax sp. J22P168]
MVKLAMKRVRLCALFYSAAAMVAHAQTAPDFVEPLTKASVAKAYWSGKAQCWADLAKAEASQGDTRNTPAIAGGNAARIRTALSEGEEPTASLERPLFGQEILPAASGRYGRPQWRADLVNVESVLARYRERNCRTPKVGCLEVARQSVYENLEETQGARWNHGRPELDHAVALAKEAGGEFEAACTAQDSLEAIHVPQAPGLNGIDVPQAPALEVVEVPADMLFRFDQARAEGMLAGGRAEIDAVAGRIKAHGATAGAIAVIGHTDRLGLPERNQALSKERAETVAKLLQRAGVTLPIEPSGAGASAPLTGDRCEAVTAQQALIDCLQPDRRVVVRILPPGPFTSSR